MEDRIYLDNNRHVGEADLILLGNLFDVCSQFHQPGHVHLVVVPERWNVRSCRHCLHHCLPDTLDDLCVILTNRNCLPWSERRG